MLKTNRILLALFFSLLTLASCTEDGGNTNNGNGGHETVTPPEPFKAMAPPFNSDSAYAYIEKQLSFGPRIPNTPGHRACADWMVAKFKEFKAEVTVQAVNLTAWDKTVFQAKNIIASYNPKASKRVIVSAHWDSRPFADKDPNQPSAPVPGANDAGSGVGVILELARQLADHPPKVGIDFILWDAEDYGNYELNESWCLGSQYWSKTKHKPGYRATWGINLDMVGAANANFLKDGYSLQWASQYVEQVWAIAYQLGYGSNFPSGNFNMASIDDHYFVMELAGIPMVEIMDRKMETGEFFPHWHKVTDNMEQIDRKSLKAVGQTVLEVILREK